MVMTIFLWRELISCHRADRKQFALQFIQLHSAAIYIYTRHHINSSWNRVLDVLSLWWGW